MPRCASCGTFFKKGHLDFDGRTERQYCDFCFAEREWKLEGKLDKSEEMLVVPAPKHSWWKTIKKIFGVD